MTEEMFHLLIRGCTNAFQLHITEMKLHSFTVFSTRLCLNPQQYHNINTGASPVCICVCVCMCVSSLFTTVMSIPNRDITGQAGLTMALNSVCNHRQSPHRKRNGQQKQNKQKKSTNVFQEVFFKFFFFLTRIAA